MSIANILFVLDARDRRDVSFFGRMSHARERLDERRAPLEPTAEYLTDTLE